MKKAVRELSANMLWLCIDTCDRISIHGNMYSIMKKEPMVFKDFDQMILLADRHFDAIGYPQSFQKKRSFNDREQHVQQLSCLRKKPVNQSNDIMIHTGKVTTVILQLVSRQHTNWQGYLLDTGFQKIAVFDDVIHLLNIMLQDFAS